MKWRSNIGYLGGCIFLMVACEGGAIRELAMESVSPAGDREAKAVGTSTVPDDLEIEIARTRQTIDRLESNPDQWGSIEGLQELHRLNAELDQLERSLASGEPVSGNLPPPVDKDDHHLLIISVPDQLLELRDGGRSIARFPVSTSKFGLGDEPGSRQTPPGEMCVASKVGAGEPSGMQSSRAGYPPGSSSGPIRVGRRSSSPGPSACGVSRSRTGMPSAARSTSTGHPRNRRLGSRARRAASA